MIRELILHIGISKTGSTSIQSALAAHRQMLAGQGVYVPTSPGKFAHTLLAAAAVRDQKELRKFASRHFGGIEPSHRIDLFRNEFRAELDRLPDSIKKCVVTSELFSERLFENDEIERLGAMLLPYFSRTRVLVYLRRQDQHAASNYTQYLRSGMNVAPGLNEPWAINARMLHFDQLLDRYARVFGKASITPRIFSRNDLVNGNVIDDFAYAAGLAMPEELALETNQSISWEGQQILRAAITVLGPKLGATNWQELPAWTQMALSISKALPGAGWRPTRQEAAKYMERFSDGNERVRTEYFPGRPTLFDMDFSNLPEAPCQEKSAAALAASTEALFYCAKELNIREASACMAQYRLLKRLEDRPAMRASLTRVLFFDPSNLNARLLLATHCMQDGDINQAWGHAETALKQAPESKYARNILNRLALRAKRAAGQLPLDEPEGDISRRDSVTVASPARYPSRD